MLAEKSQTSSQGPRVGVIGLGYVGLPVAVAFGKQLGDVVGFDISERRVKQLNAGVDTTGEVQDDDLASCEVYFTTNPRALVGCDFYIVTVPTPIDSTRKPDLRALKSASSTVGSVMRAGAIVVYESTVYPGVTEEICGPILEEASGLRMGVDFKLGYSPERINPGDRVHRFETIVKVVSGQDEDALADIAELYEGVVKAGVHRASSIRVAEAAKVIENTQRDLNIALMNELSVVFDRLDIDTIDVLTAAQTKWNFLPFYPGLVGGHCIGVDPYYLTSKAEQAGVHPQVILAGRRTNDGMAAFVVERTIKELIAADKPIRDAKIAVVGVTFKENVPDVRNSRIPEICRSLVEYGAKVSVFDPLADPNEVAGEYGLSLAEFQQIQGSDAILFAVPHDGLAESVASFTEHENTAVLIDVKGAVSKSSVANGVRYWRL